MRWNWIKLATDIHSNPRIELAGRDAREVFIYLLCLNGQHGGDGIVHRRYLDPRLIARKVGVTESNVTPSLSLLVEYDLVAWCPDGSLSLLGWDEEWSPYPKTNTERQRKFRERLRQRNASVTKSNASNDSNARNVEEKRIEEKILCEADEFAEGTGVRTVPQPDLAAEVLAYLNERAGKSYRETDGTLRPIRARLAEHSVDECKRVVDMKTREWRGTEREKYLRPSTLFRPTNFEEYLGQTPKGNGVSMGELMRDCWEDK